MDPIFRLIRALEFDDLDQIRELVPSDVPISQFENIDEYSPFFVAIECGNVEIMRFLLESNVSTEVVDSRARTPLHLAVSLGNKEIIQTLLDARADINACDVDDKTPFYRAVSIENKEIVQFLADAKADINMPNSCLKSPLLLAAQRGNKEIVKFLLERKMDDEIFDSDINTSLHVAIFHGHKEIPQLLLEAQANIETLDSANRTPLCAALLFGQDEIVKVLLEAKANVNVFMKIGSTLYLCEEYTLLYFTLMKNDMKTAKLLLDFRANINEYNSSQETPLRHAIMAENRTVLKFLIDHEAWIHANDKNGRSVLDRSSRQIKEFLLRSSTPINFDWSPAVHSLVSETTRQTILLIMMFWSIRASSVLIDTPSELLFLLFNFLV